MSNLRFRVTAAALLSTGALLAAPAVAAQAAPSAPAGQVTVAAEKEWYHGGAPTGGCESGKLCAYWDTHWGGRLATFEFTNKNWNDPENPNKWMNDKSSSWYNNGTAGAYDSVIIAEHADNRGLSVCIDRGWGIKRWPDIGDKVSSNKWVNGPCP